METLIITAHPSKGSFTKALADKLNKEIRDSEIMDLYDQKYTQDFLRYEKISDIEVEPKRSMIQEKISKAKKLVFIHPIYWGLPPAIMKNFCDQNFTAGFAFKYVKGKSSPEGLLKGKKAYVFMTCDAPAFIYNYIFRLPKMFWAAKGLGILPFCGIDIQSVKMFGKMRKSSDEQRQKWLNEVLEIVR